jgi:hypothetical protein
MKAIRYIPAYLLLFLFVSNLYLGIITRPDRGSVVYLIIGVIYLSLGALMLSKFRFSELLGFIIPLAILFLYPVLVDFKSLHALSSGFLGAIDAIIVICCLILLLNKL